MKSRFGVLFLVLLSSAVLVFFARELVNQNDRLEAAFVFNDSDSTVLIINRSSELALEDIPVEFNSGQKEFTQLLLNDLSTNRFYISTQKAHILIESSSLWDVKSMNELLNRLNLKYTFQNEKWRLANSYKVKIKQNFALFYQGELALNATAFTFPNWDKKASASILYLGKKPSSTAIYAQKNGLISFLNRTENKAQGKKIDDAALFSEQFPIKGHNYHFYERDFALFSNVLSEKSPLYQWMENGFIRFDYLETPCIISDYVSNQDPLLILNDLKKQDKNDVHLYHKVNLIRDFPSTFYAYHLGDKVLLTTQKEIAEKIISDYQLGKTISQVSEFKNLYFGRLPQLVSERFISKNEQFSRAVYHQLWTETRIGKSELNETDFENEIQVEVQEQSWSQAIQGELVYILGRGNEQFVFSSGNELFALGNQKIKWKARFDGDLLAKPMLIQLVGIESHLFFTTSTKIYLLDKAGNAVTGFPKAAQNTFTASASYFVWKNKPNFVFVDGEKLIRISETGKVLGQMNTKLDGLLYPPFFFSDRNRPILALTSASKSTTFNLDSYRSLKSRNGLIPNGVVIQSNNGPQIYVHENGSFKRSDYTGKTTDLGNYANPSLLQICSSKNGERVAFEAYGKIHVFNEQGTKLFQVDVPFKKIESFDVFTTNQGKTYLAFVDEIENNIQILDQKGNAVLAKMLEGKGKVYLSERGNRLNVTASTQGFIVQYLDVLSVEK